MNMSMKARIFYTVCSAVFMGIAVSALISLSGTEDAVPLDVRLCVYSCLGLWFSLLTRNLKMVSNYPKDMELHRCTKRSKELLETATMYMKMGMEEEGKEALKESRKLNERAGAILEGKWKELPKWMQDEDESSPNSNNGSTNDET
jgi:hypothetical protein